eukprot:gene32397-39177_t
MDSNLKPEIQKTIKRLSSQNNHEVLKNKIRSWLLSRELTVSDLIKACKDKVITVSPSVLNKLGLLYGSGKEGLNEEPETAFTFYLAAADFGHASAAGNVAQYYFDGRAPGGRNVDTAYQFCKKAVEMGADKYMLLSEILHEKRDYEETIKCLRKIIEIKKHVDATLCKKKVEARKLEIQCLFKLLDRTFTNVSLPEQQDHSMNTMTNMLMSSSLKSPLSINTFTSPSTPSYASPLSARRLGGAQSPRSGGLALSSMLQGHASSSITSSFNKSFLSPKSPTRPFSQHTTSHASFTHTLPGWNYITEELEGFDMSACSELTAKAEVLEMEAEALKTAYETAEARLQHGRKNKFSDEVINALMRSKVSEFHDIYENLQQSKSQILDSWHAYTDISEHILRRQIVTEKRYFSPQKTRNPLTLHIARELFHRRLYDYPDYLDADWNTFYQPEQYLNQPLNLCALGGGGYLLPPARCILTAERSILEVSIAAYGRARSAQHSTFTGWTGQFNLSVYPTLHAPASAPEPTTESGEKKTNSSSALLQETTYVETVVIDGAALKYQHLTHPVLPPPNLQHRTHATAAHGHKKKKHHARELQEKPVEHNGEGAGVGYDSEGVDCDLSRYEHYYHMQDLGSSKDIQRFIDRITSMNEDAQHYRENERRLVDLILRFLRQGKPFQLTDLQNMNDDVSEADCANLTRVVYHYFVKRLVPWVLARPTLHLEEGSVDKYSLFDLPLASAQVRVLQLIGMGVLSFEEAFSSSQYGILGDDHTYSSLRSQIIEINTLYQKAVLEASATNFHAYMEFWKAHPRGSSVPSYSRLFAELCEVYGDAEEAEEETEAYGSDDKELYYLVNKLKI